MRDTSWIKTREELDQLSIPELETLAIEAGKIRGKSSYTGENDYRNILENRKYRLNKEFIFTPEYIEKFLWLDREIKKYADILRKEGEKMLEHLERMKKDENSFFNDYEIECIIEAVIEDKDDENFYDGILWAIEWFQYKTGDIWRVKFSPKHLEHSIYFEEFYSDEDKANGTNNWNTTIYKWRDLIKENPELAKHHIGYGMHQLCDHSHWAWQDIMKISGFHCDLIVEYQKY